MQDQHKRAEKAWSDMRQKENLELNELKLKKSDCLHPAIWKLQVKGLLINLSSFCERDNMFGQ